MNDKWNRRLLAAYPKSHRAEYGEEMLDVLAECGGGPRESLDLVASGLRMRLGGLGSPWRTPEWRDAFAVVSLIAPLLMTVPSVWYVDHLVRGLTGEFTTGPGFTHGLLMDAPPWLAGAIMLAAAWWGGINGRRFAIAAGLALCVYAFTGDNAFTTTYVLHMALSLLVPVLALAGLVLSDGPRRGAAVLGRAVTVPMLAIAGLAFAAQGLAGLQYPVGLHLVSGRPFYEDAWTLILAVLVLNGLRTAAGRRAAALLMTPFLFAIAPWLLVPMPSGAGVAIGFMLVLAMGLVTRLRPAR